MNDTACKKLLRSILNNDILTDLDDDIIRDDLGLRDGELRDLYEEVREELRSEV